MSQSPINTEMTEVIMANYFVRVFNPKGEQILEMEISKALIEARCHEPYGKTEEEQAWLCLTEIPDPATVLKNIRSTLKRNV